MSLDLAEIRDGGGSNYLIHHPNLLVRDSPHPRALRNPRFSPYICPFSGLLSRCQATTTEDDFRLPTIIPITTIEDAGHVGESILGRSEQLGVTAKFRCIIRVVAMLPSNPKDFCSPKGTYRIRLTLEDPTARIHAYLFGEDAEKFFGGYPGIDELTQKRNTFLGIAGTDGCNEAEDAPRIPPWMLCCINSYYLDKQNMWESRTYAVSMTKLICC